MCALAATAQQVSVKTPPFDLVGETLPVFYGDVPLSPPGRTLPLSGKLVQSLYCSSQLLPQHFDFSAIGPVLHQKEGRT